VVRCRHPAAPLFDERLFLYYEDLELAWRGRRRGWRYHYVPESTVRHLHAATSDQRSPLKHYYDERIFLKGSKVWVLRVASRIRRDSAFQRFASSFKFTS